MTRNEELNEQMRDERREQIRSMAVKLFAIRGLQATKIADIAKAVGMSQGLMYHYYPSKEAIFVEIIESAFEKMSAAARGLSRLPLSPEEKLETAVTEVLDSIKTSDEFIWTSVLITMASVSDTVPEAASAVIEREREIPYKTIERIVRAGQKAGTVRKGTPRDLSLVFWTAVKGLAMHKAALGSGFKPPHPDVLRTIFFE